MNRIYKVIWSKARNCYVVVSEIAKTHSKGGTGVSGVVKKVGSSALLTAAVTAMLMTPLGTAWAAVDIGENPGQNAKASYRETTDDAGRAAGHLEIGKDVSANGNNSVAIGIGSSAAGTSSVAIGEGAGAGDISGVAIGHGATSNDKGGTSVGDGAITKGKDSSAYGSGSQATGSESVAMGHNSEASGSESISIGNLSEAKAGDAVAVGEEAHAHGGDSTAVGADSQALTGSDSAFGHGAIANGKGSGNEQGEATAVGNNATAQETRATALGASADAMAEDSTALGSNALAEGERSVALGGADGQEEAAHASGKYSSAIGTGTEATGVSSTAVGGGPQNNGAQALEDGAIAIGGGGEDALGANASGVNSTAVGVNTSASGVQAVAIGSGAKNDPGASAAADKSIVIGANATSDEDATNGVAIGTDSHVTVENGVALGAGSIASTDKDIKGYVPNPNRVPDTTISTWTSTEAAVSIGATDESGNPTMTRQITGVAAGTNDWDAANVAQLKAAMTHYYSINDDPIEQPNYNNDGATGKNAMAAGIGASATGNLSVALGTYAKANGLNSIAIGSAQVKTKIDPETGKVIIDSVSEPTTANGQNALAVGYYNTATGNNSTAVGSVNTTNGDIASAIGHYNQATAYGASAIGNTNRASAPDSSAIGKNNTASNSYANAIGGSNSAGGQYSSAIGHYNQTSSYASNANAIGDNNEASASEASAIGHHNSASAGNANAIGDNNYASGQYSTAVGHYNHASGQDSSALGDNNYAYGNLSSAVGHYNYAYGGNSSAIGDNNKAYNSNSSAIGAMNTANSAQSSAIGHYNTASAEYATAMGENNQATGYGASAIGKNNYANGSQSTAIGNTNTANASDSVAVGKYNTASSDNASAIGTTNTASGQYSTAVGHYNTASAQDASALGSNNYAEAYQSNAVGHYNHATAANANALGDNNWATAQAASAIGQVNTASGSQSTAVGHYNRATAGNTTAVGENNLAEAESATAVGKNNIASNYAASAVGFNNTAKGSFSSALGTNATAEKYGSIAIGGNGTVNHYISDGTELDGTELTLKKDSSGNDIYTYIDADGNEIQYTNTSAIVSGSAVAKGNNAVVLGAESVANVDGSVALGAFSKADRGPEQEDGYDPFGEAHDGSPTWRATAAAVSVGGKTFTNDDGEEVTYTRQITNVAAGREDTDAVNVAQLKTLAKTIESAGDHYFSADDYVPAGTDDDGNPTEEQNVIKRVHGQRLAVIGDAKTTTDPESGEEVTQANIVTSVVAGDATTGTLNTIKIELGRDLDVDTVVVNGKDGKDGLTIKGADGAPGTIGMAGKDGEIKTITLNGKDGEDGSPGVDGESITRLIVDEHEVATLDDGLKFGANAPEEEEGDNPVANKLNSTVKIVGVDAKEDHEYSADNLTTTVKQAEDGTTTITVMMDKDPEFDTLVVNGKDGAPGEPGTPGSIGMKGEDGEIKTVTITTEGAPGVDGKDGETITRLIVDDKPVATLDDGMKYSGDFGNTKDNPVAVKLNKNVDVVGNATAKSADDLTDGNIGVVAEPEIDKETGEATGNAKLTIKLNKDINLGTDGSLTVGGEVDEEGNPKTDEYGNPTSIKIGPQEVYNINRGPETGDYIIGLDNKTWDPTNIVSGRAATEDQLAAVQTHYYSVNDIVDGEEDRQANWANDGATGKFALAAGTNAKATGDRSVAVGDKARVTTDGGVAIGADSVATTGPSTGGYDVITGARDFVDTANAHAWTSSAAAVSVGNMDGNEPITRQITGVAAGTLDTDAVNVAQLRRVANAASIHDYSVNSVDPTHDQNYNNSGAVGSNALAAGVNARALGDNAVAVGNATNAQKKDAVAIGNGADAFNENSVALGANTQTAEEVGTASYEIAGTTYYFAGAKPVGTVSVGTEGVEGDKRTITNVAAGRISEESTDAINGSQLWAVTEAMKSGHTEVTVGEGTPAGEGEGVYNTAGNLDLNVTQAEDGHNIYDLKLAKDIDVDTIVVNGKDGKDGKIGINGKDGETSYITVSGKDGAPGVDGVTTTRILIDDKPVATLDDGMKYSGDFGNKKENPVPVKLNKIVDIRGNADNEDDLTDKNIGVVAEATDNGENAKLTIKLNKDINLGEEGSITIGDVHIHDGDEISFGGNQIHDVASGVTGDTWNTTNVPEGVTYNENFNNAANIGDIYNVAQEVINPEQGGGFGLSDEVGNAVMQKLGKSVPVIGDSVYENGRLTKDGNILTNVAKDRDGNDAIEVSLNRDLDVDTVVINGKDGAPGEPGLTIKGADGAPGAIGIDGADGETKIITLSGKDGKDGTPGLDGESITRLIVDEHEVATMDDGMKYSGDFGNKKENPVQVKLNNNVDIVGNPTAKSADDLTDGNIGVVAAATEDGGAQLVVKLNKDVNLGSDGSLKVGGDTEGNNSIVIGNQEATHVDGTKETGDYITGLDNTDWDPDNIVSGRAATEDQLAKAMEEAESHHTEVTVNGGTAAPADGSYTDDGGNLQLNKTTGSDGQSIYDLKLSDNITLGKDGKDGVDGKIGINGKDGNSVVIGHEAIDGKDGADGKDGIAVNGKDGKNGVTIWAEGKDGADGHDGHIGIAGPAGKDGADGITDIHTKWGEGTVGPYGKDGKDGTDGITRIVYTDPEGDEHEVATMDDGLKFKANTGDPNPAANRLSSTVEIVGAGDKDDENYSGKNLKTIISQTGEGKDAVTTINVVMDKDLETDTVVINGKDGKDGLTIKGADGEPGSIGMAGKDGEITHITINNDGKPGVDGKDGITRIEYKDPEGNDHEVATLDDGMKYGGDTGDVIAKKLNEQVNVIGGITDESKLTETDNIGVVSDGTDNLKVRLAKDIDLGKEGSVTIGDTTINNEGLTINEGPSVTKNGIDAGSKKITNVAPGEADTDAVNVSQLKDFAGDVNRNIGDVNNRINRLGDRVDKVGAGAAALAGLHPLDFDPDAKWDVAAGYGHYRGENAVAVGAFYRPSEDVMVNVASTVGNGDNMISAGVSVKVGGNTHVSNSRVALSKQVLEMRKEIEDMRSLMADSAFGKQLDLSKLQLFPDTPENHWAYDYVATLAGNGLLEGYPDGNFRGDRALTRYEVAAILYRAMLNGAQLTQRALEEFAPELDRIRVDTLTRHSDGTPSIQRVRIIKDRR